MRKSVNTGNKISTFGSLLPQRNFSSEKYRFGFNGMEKDDEVKGIGNNLDFGARIYDSRVGRWLALDPLATKYPSWSPYHAFANNPIIFKDSDGKENVIYLTDLSLNKPSLSLNDKRAIIVRLQKIADAANNGYKSKGLTPRVIVIDYIPVANKLDKSDVLATLGTKQELQDFDNANSNHAGSKKLGDYDLVGVSNMGPEESTSMGGYGGDAGDRIALDVNQINNGFKGQNFDSPEAYAAWLIQHGSGHNAAIAHSDGKNTSRNQEQSGEGPDLMTSGQTNQFTGFSITEGNGTWITTDTFLTDAAQKITIEALDTLYLFSTFEEMFGYMEYSSAKTTKLKGGSISMGGPLLPIFVKNYSKTAGEKAYELVSHLGNVHMVISDRKVSVEDGSSGNVAYFVSDVISTNDVYPFGSLLPQRNFSSEKYRYGAFGYEKDDEVKGSGNHISFNDYGYDPRTGRRWNVDPKAHKYPQWSPYAAFACNPIFYVDQDGREVKGFSVNEKGDVLFDAKVASKDAITIYNAMSKTGMGTAAFKNLVTSETKFTLKVTSKEIEGAHAQTQGEGMTANGAYEKATITISTARTGDRFDLTNSNEELINVVGTHESVHATNKEQIKKDQALPEDVPWTWEQESLPINTEYSAWKEYRQKYGGDIAPLKNIYETPSDQKKDPAGNAKPALYGVDKSGAPLTKPEEEK